MIVTASLESGGAERVISQLVTKWSQNNIKCSLVLLRKVEHFYSIPKTVKIYEIGQLHSVLYIDKIIKYKRVREIVNENRPDIVLTLPEEIGIYVIGALFGLRIPVVVSERNDPWIMPYKKATRFLRKVLYPFADGFIFQTKQAASFFSENIQKRGIVLPNPLELQRLPLPYSGERNHIIVGVGRLEKQKNFKLLIDAFAIVQKKHSDYKLVIYGEGTLRKELEQYAENKLAPQSWDFPGRCADVLERINSATCFVLSSDYEGVPNALIEALALGIPCVATDCKPGGAASLISDNHNGYLVPIGDCKKMAEKIVSIINSTEIANIFSEEGKKICDIMDADKVSRMWVHYLRKVISKK